MARAASWRAHRVVLAAAGVLLAVPAPADEAAPTWAADRENPGPRLPPAGRSLFDAEFGRVVAGELRHDLPFPFSEVIERLDARSGGHLRAVLIPIGRSLQRSAAHPDYFQSPRVVVAVVGDAPVVWSAATARGAAERRAAATAAGAASPPIGDRLFLGYQERAAIIEVISYNEEAGRFEFQIVEDYRAGSVPRVTYAERGSCAACHQGLAPIFSRPLWDETNANADVARRLAAVRDAFHSVPASLGIDVPDAIDNATDRANRFALYQRIWSEACGPQGAGAVQCRADLLLEALRYRLAGERHWRGPGSRREAIAARLTERWSEIWPGGLAMTDPDIPNRRLELFAPGRGPLDLPGALQDAAPISTAATSAIAAVPERLEPSIVRAPLEIWSAETLDTGRIDELIAGLASFFSEREIAELDRLLASGSGSATATAWNVPCTERALENREPDVADGAAAGRSPSAATRLRLVCGARGDATLPKLDASLTVPAEQGADAALVGNGTLLRFTMPEADDLRGRAITLARGGDDPSRSFVATADGPLRAAMGDALRLTVLRGGATSTLRVELVRDFTRLAAAIETLAAAALDGRTDALADLPLRRSTVHGELLEHLRAASH